MHATFRAPAAQAQPLRLTLLAALLTAGLLTACGGGGGSGSDSSSGGTSGSGSTSTTPAVKSTIAGVAAFGAPLTSARVQVVDATGTLVGSATTHAADGSYALTLTTATPTAPLLLQATGLDASGQPVALHSALSTIAASNTVNLTPLTDAIVALTLGADPKTVFANAKTQATLLASLATLTPASDFLKTLVKSNLADAKTGDLSKLNLLGDSAFRADKTGVDLALEALRISVGPSTQGKDQLQLSNLFSSNIGPEVVVDLATARTELGKTTGATPANAITSTLKATTSPTLVIANFSYLDELGTAINKAIAEGAGASGAAITALTSKYLGNNGRDAAGLADLLASYSTRNMQLGKFQVIGCADDIQVKNSCNKIRVAARVSDASGAQADTFIDALTYASGSSPRWSIVGNAHAAEVGVQPLAWLALGADGSTADTGAANPALGVQLRVQNNVAGATVQTPGGYSLPLVPCAGLDLLCLTSVPGATSAVATGEVRDHGVLQTTSNWLGSADLAVGARYKVTLTPLSGSAQTSYATLSSLGSAAAPASRFPVVDGVKSSLPLAGAALLNGTSLSWASWAAANGDMRLLTVRLVLSSDSDPAKIIDTAPANATATSITLAAPSVPADFVISGIKLWLIAVDGSGRRYMTSYTVL